jgi:hypothetical protein
MGATRFRPVPNRVQFVYKWCPPNPGVHLALFADDTCFYCTDSKEIYVLRKQQRGLTSMEFWCERWKININKGKTQAIYFSRRQRRSRRNILFVNEVKYLGAIINRKITRRIHIEAIEVKAFRIFLSVHSLFISQRLSANIKLTFHKALIRSIMTCAYSAGNLG